MNSNKSTPLPAWALDAVSELPPLVSANRTAKFFHVSVRTVSRWIRQGRINSLRTSESGSGRVLIPRLEIARLLTEMAN